MTYSTSIHLIVLAPIRSIRITVAIHIKSAELSIEDIMDCDMSQQIITIL